MNVKFLSLTAAQYAAATKEQGTFYLVDNTQLYIGEELLSNNAALVQAIADIAKNTSDIELLEKEIAALTGTENEDGETTSISSMISDAIAASEAKMSAEIDADVLVEKTRAEGIETGLDTRLTAVEEDVNTFFASADLTENAKDTLKEIQDYINSDATAAAELTASLNQAKTDIDVLEATVANKADTTTVTQLDTDFKSFAAQMPTELEKAEQNAKDYADSLAGNYATAAQGAKADTAVQSVTSGSANGTISVDGTDVAVKGLGSAAYTASTAYETAGAAATAEQNAKDYADGLATNYDASGSASTALASAKTYTDEAIAAALVWETVE